MELALKIIGAFIGLLSLAAAIYNIFGGRSYLQEQAQKAKIEQALALGNENKKDIQHLKEHVDIHNATTKDRLDQIGADVSYVKDLFVKWLLNSANKS